MSKWAKVGPNVGGLARPGGGVGLWFPVPQAHVQLNTVRCTQHIEDHLAHGLLVVLGSAELEVLLVDPEESRC